MIKINNYFLALLVLPFILSNYHVSGQINTATAQITTFQSTYGSGSNYLGNFVQQTTDGGYIICGAKGNAGTAGYYNYYLTKINSIGVVQWTNTISDSSYDDQAQCIRQTPDGGYIVYGSRSGSSNSSGWLMKTDDNGNEKWATEQQGNGSGRYGYAVITTPDGGYETGSYDVGAADSDFFQLQKTDSSGNMQWGPKNVIQGVGTSSSLALTKDNNYVSVGTAETIFDTANGNYYSMITLVKMSSAGALLWSKSYKSNPGTNSENYLQGFGVDATGDGGYIICGSTGVNTHGGLDIFLLKTDANGDSVWSKNYGGSENDIALSVKEVPTGGFVITGNTSSYGKGSSNIFILRTTATGDSSWMQLFGGTGTQTAGNIEVTADSGYVVAGSSNSYGTGQNQVFIIKTDSSGMITKPTVQGIEENNNNITYTVFPNPATDVVHINYDVQSASSNYFVIYSAEGKEIVKERLDSEKGILTISTSQLASGLYFSGIETDGDFVGRTTIAVVHR